MEKSRIKQVKVVNGQSSDLYLVGYTKLGDGKVVKEIEDASREYEDHIHSLYLIKDVYGNVLVRIENCPVVVEYAIDNL